MFCKSGFYIGWEKGGSQINKLAATVGRPNAKKHLRIKMLSKSV
jgi:hypothetical protein